MRLNNKNAKIYIAGHRGMVGAAVWRRLEQAGYKNLVGRTSSELDLRDPQATHTFFAGEQPAFVVLAAARVGGILANDQYPADFIGDNLAIQQSVITAAHEAGVQRLVFLGSTCIYPKHAPQPMPEESLLTGSLEPTNQWYAVAKIAGIKICQAYHKQHGDNFVSLMPTNLYGPNDNFDLETSHVLPALLRKFHEAKGVASDGSDVSVTLWGSGTPKREFLHLNDLADAILFILQQPEATLRDAAPDGIFNVGVGDDLSINELAALIQDIVSHEGPIEHDTSKPDGTPRKLVNTSRLNRLGWNAKTPLREGIRTTYEWFREHYALNPTP